MAYLSFYSSTDPSVSKFATYTELSHLYYLLTYLITYLLSYSLTHSLHGAESFLGS
jgi:hypothetical protein